MYGTTYDTQSRTLGHNRLGTFFAFGRLGAPERRVRIWASPTLRDIFTLYLFTLYLIAVDARD
jgi:hypothetical protein